MAGPDPFGGAADLMAKVLRTPLAPAVSFRDDPLRLLRAARFIDGYDLQPTDALVEAPVRRIASVALSALEVTCRRATER